MFKNKKIIACSLIGIPLIPIAVVSTTSFSSILNSKDFIFRGQRFSSYDEAIQYAIRNNIFKIKTEKEIGSYQYSLGNNGYNTLDPKHFRKYDPGKISYIYQGKDIGRFYKSKEEAANSYLESFQEGFQTTSGSFTSSRRNASISIRGSKKYMTVPAIHLKKTWYNLDNPEDFKEYTRLKYAQIIIDKYGDKTAKQTLLDKLKVAVPSLTYKNFKNFLKKNEINITNQADFSGEESRGKSFLKEDNRIDFGWFNLRFLKNEEPSLNYAIRVGDQLQLLQTYNWTKKLGTHIFNWKRNTERTVFNAHKNMINSKNASFNNGVIDFKKIGEEWEKERDKVPPVKFEDVLKPIVYTSNKYYSKTLKGHPLEFSEKTKGLLKQKMNDLIQQYLIQQFSADDEFFKDDDINTVKMEIMNLLKKQPLFNVEYNFSYFHSFGSHFTHRISGKINQINLELNTKSLNSILRNELSTNDLNGAYAKNLNNQKSLPYLLRKLSLFIKAKKWEKYPDEFNEDISIWKDNFDQGKERVEFDFQKETIAREKDKKIFSMHGIQKGLNYEEFSLGNIQENFKLFLKHKAAIIKTRYPSITNKQIYFDLDSEKNKLFFPLDGDGDGIKKFEVLVVDKAKDTNPRLSSGKYNNISRFIDLHKNEINNIETYKKFLSFYVERKYKYRFNDKDYVNSSLLTLKHKALSEIYKVNSSKRHNATNWFPEVSINHDYIFYKSGMNKIPLRSTIFDSYGVWIDGSMIPTMYFKTYNDLRSFLKDYIKNNSKQA